MQIKKEDFSLNEPIPRWIKFKKGLQIPLFIKAVKPRGTNLWHLRRIAIVKTKRKFWFFGPQQGLLDWAQIADHYFTKKENAESFARIISANNGNTAKHLEGDIIHSKVLDFIEDGNAK